MTFIQIQVPQNAEVGDTLTFSVEGSEVEINVPEGVRVGDVLQIQVDSGNDDNNCKGNGAIDEEHEKKQQYTKESNSTQDASNGEDLEEYQVPLHESLGITLEMKCSISSEPEKVEEGNTDKKDSSRASNGDGTYAMAWPAGLHLAKCISSPNFQKFLTNKRAVVELGSGLGLVGLAFITTASLISSHRKSDAKKIKTVLTDFPSSLPLIEHNISWNKDRLSSSSATVYENIKVEPLIWGDSSCWCSLSGKTDLILASDILYHASVDTYQSLIKTISSLIYGKNNDKPSNKNKCEILISVRWRKPEEERIFFQLMESTFGFKFELIYDEIENDKYKCNLQWREFGNPLSEKSNEYFTNTLTKVNDKFHALKDITEEQMDRMSEDEYTSFEARYIQIYVGRMIK